MQDRYQRQIDYLRISITDLCNLRCTYCMPETGIPQKEHADILSLEEILTIVKAVTPLGIRKIRLTGGEPLIRKGVVDLIHRISEVPGIEDISLTTNGILLGKMAGDLKKAGLSRVNISLDTLNADKYKEITRIGKIDDVLNGIHAAVQAGLNPVKINTVVIKGFNDQELGKLAALTQKLPIHVRFIELMPIGESSDKALETYIPAKEVRALLEQKVKLTKVQGIKGGGPAVYYEMPGALGTVGFIGALSEHFCNACNRLRLTADGKLRPCLQKSTEFDLKAVLRQGGQEEEIRQIFLQTIFNKPKEHNMELERWGEQARIMSQIGG
jgi:cyclic pyranopterin phosphate synthase